MAQLNSKQSIERREVLNRSHLKFRDELRAAYNYAEYLPDADA